ncbi:hypothetical protein [Burkholderia sp. F1]
MKRTPMGTDEYELIHVYAGRGEPGSGEGRLGAQSDLLHEPEASWTKR